MRRLKVFREKIRKRFQKKYVDFSAAAISNFLFSNRETVIYLPSPEDSPSNDIDTCKIVLRDVFCQDNAEVVFAYDFGDNLEFKIKLEDVMDNTEWLTVRCPVKVVAGKYCGIIDECGGAHGLKHLLNVLKEVPENEEYAETVKWLDKENFNFKEFDVEEINS